MAWVDWLKRSGITFPQGSEATYVADRSLLISRNSKDNLEKIDVLLNSGAPRDQPASIRSEIVVATLHAPGELLDNPSLALSELKKSPGIPGGNRQTGDPFQIGHERQRLGHQRRDDAKRRG